MNRLTFVVGLLATLVLPAHARDTSSTRSPMLMHGNYCGFGNNAPAAPIDALDAACARHDACTPDDGLPSEVCNVRLRMDAERVAQDSRQPGEMRMLAGLVASGAAMMPSAPAARADRVVARGSVASRPPVPASFAVTRR